MSFTHRGRVDLGVRWEMKRTFRNFIFWAQLTLLFDLGNIYVAS